MAARRSNDDDRRELRGRVTELEARVRWLERRLHKVAKAAKVKPEPQPPSSGRPRCPHCFSDVPKGYRKKVCLFCGFSFEVVAPIRPRRRRAGQL